MNGARHGAFTADGAPSLAQTLGIPAPDLEEVRRGAELAYKVYPVPKRRGARWIEAPDPGLKEVQRRILDRLLYRLQPHPAAHGFRAGCNICTHAAPHAGRAWVATVDIEEFFPSVKRAMLEGLSGELGLTANEGDCLLDLVTRRGRLPQGAPTSPHLVNLVMRGTDARLSELAAAKGWAYSRYADDLVLSGEDDPRGMLDALQEAVVEAGYRTNRRKCRVMGRHRRQWVTGLVVNAGMKLPREQRRMLRAASHRMQTGMFRGNPQEMAGRLAFRYFIAREEHSLFAKELHDTI